MQNFFTKNLSTILKAKNINRGKEGKHKIRAACHELLSTAYPRNSFTKLNHDGGNFLAHSRGYKVVIRDNERYKIIINK